MKLHTTPLLEPPSGFEPAFFPGEEKSSRLDDDGKYD
jgi:hypothetical protein